MIEDLFRTNEAAQSSVQGVIMAILASIVLSFMLVLTYRLTSKEVIERREFMQGMALISIVAAMVMQAIGDSLARGLGMLGALSIIRFRTSLTSPRNMAFMFASLAAGIACGVFGFTIAFVGTTAFCLLAFALSFEFSEDRKYMLGELRLTLEANAALPAELKERLHPMVHKLKVAERRFDNNRSDGAESRSVQIIDYQFRLRKGVAPEQLASSLTDLPGLVSQRLRFTHSRELL